LFPLVAEAVAKVLPVESVRWITFGHVESDECGSMNMWLAAAPRSQVAHGALGCDISLNDLCDRRPRALAEGEVIDLGGKRVRQISTPHVPHGWEAQVLFEETTGTLLCGDLFTHIGATPAVTRGDVVERALAAERMFHATALAPHTVQTLRGLGDLNPKTLAIMHGSSYEGNGRQALYDLAAGYEKLIAETPGVHATQVA
jgi:flavorubredoxin